MTDIEIVVPAYNEKESIRPFVKAISSVMEQIGESSWNILFIDDGSSDGTLSEIKAVVSEGKYPDRIKYISLARNFGKEGALYAGLQRSTGELVIVMDADLQHPPELIPEMVSAVREDGWDCVGARRISRNGEPFVKSVLSGGYYHVINWLTGMNLVSGMTDYRIMKRNVVDAIVSMQERERFTKGIYSWVGFKTKWIEYENVERAYGSSKWSVKGLWSYAKIGFIAFATAPLRGVIYLGMLVVILSFIYALILLHQTMFMGRTWQDTTTIILLLLFLGGVIITVLGIIGEYIARIYMETKGRPIYIERESNLNQ